MSNRVALITGASSGLGTQFARPLAHRKISLVLVARRAEPMERPADELRRRDGVELLVQSLDLALPGAAATLAERLDELELAPDFLVNNVVFGLSGNFLDQDLKRVREMLQLDILSLVELPHMLRAVVPEDKQTRRATILDSARTLFQQSHEQLPTAAEIAKTAGLAKGPVYLYSKTKEEISQICSWKAGCPSCGRQNLFSQDPEENGVIKHMPSFRRSSTIWAAT